MGWTRRQFVEQAFEEIGYATYVYDLEPEQIEAAARRLDAMMATWNGRGIRVGYPLPQTPGSGELDEDTLVPDYANEAIYLNLGIRLAPVVGKTVSRETKVNARVAYTQLLNQMTAPVEMQMPGSMPAGAGHKPYQNQNEFLNPPSDPIDVGQDGELDLEG